MMQVKWEERDVYPSAQANAAIRRLYPVYKNGVIPKSALSGADASALQSEGFLTSTNTGDYKLTPDGVMLGELSK